MSGEVLVERAGAVLLITINRPQARNALNGAVAAGIRDAADELDADDDLRAGVLTGAGGMFSAGMDLKAFLAGEVPSFPGRGLALAATKEIAYGGGDWPASQRWDEAARVMTPVFTSRDAQEGARAFAEKRAPVWKGR